MIARMDSNRTSEDFFKAHPGLVRARQQRRSVPRGRQIHHLCQQSVLRRVSARGADRDHRAQPSGRLHRQQLEPAWVATASAIARTASGSFSRQNRSGAAALSANWSDPAYRRVDRVELRSPHRSLGLEQRDHKAAGGPDCLWFGMNSGSITAQSPVIPRLQARSRSARRW